MHEIEIDLAKLAKKAKDGDTKSFDKILEILDPEIKKISKKYYINGSDEQDVTQECRLGIWKAVKDFDENMGMSFKNFSIGLCVKRHLITAMSHANTQKFRLHNEAVSLSAPVSQSEEDGIQTYADYIPDPNSDILEHYLIQEEFDTNFTYLKDKLTKLEMSIFHEYTVNPSYKDIADNLECKPKTVDNALMRIRKKSNEVYQTYLSTFNIINLGMNTMGTSNVIFNFSEFSVGIATNVF